MGAMKDLMIEDLDKLADRCAYLTRDEVWDMYFYYGEMNADDPYEETIKSVITIESLLAWSDKVLERRIQDEQRVT